MGARTARVALALIFCVWLLPNELAAQSSPNQEWPKHSLGFLTEGDSFVAIPAGEFIMGSDSGNADEAPHRVRITKGFELSRFEITQAQWRAVMESPHSKARTEQELRRVDPSHFKGGELPVESVSWDLVQEFIRLLNARSERFVYRLPTEAEWEYAAFRGRTDADEFAWCEAKADGRTHPIGTMRANSAGLFDMLGNVQEWVQDWYAPDYYEGGPQEDPRGPGKSSYKVYRGGAWLSPAKQCRRSYRGFDFPNPGYYSVGFRLIRAAK